MAALWPPVPVTKRHHERRADLGPSNAASQGFDCVQKPSSLRRASGNLLETDRDQFGLRALFYDGIPIVVDDFVPDTDTLGTGTALSSIYA